jgi:hypothetical protein
MHLSRLFETQYSTKRWRVALLPPWLKAEADIEEVLPANGYFGDVSLIWKFWNCKVLLSQNCFK